MILAEWDLTRKLNEFSWDNWRMLVLGALSSAILLICPAFRESARGRIFLFGLVLAGGNRLVIQIAAAWRAPRLGDDRGMDQVGRQASSLVSFSVSGTAASSGQGTALASPSIRHRRRQSKIPEQIEKLPTH
jgi:hypothetical protein